MHSFSTPWKHQILAVRKGCIGNKWFKLPFIADKYHCFMVWISSLVRTNHKAATFFFLKVLKFLNWYLSLWRFDMWQKYLVKSTQINFQTNYKILTSLITPWTFRWQIIDFGIFDELLFYALSMRYGGAQSGIFDSSLMFVYDNDGRYVSR